MTPSSIGDLATHLSTRLHISQVKAEVNTLSTELATGRSARVAEQQNGDFSRISALERSIEIVDRYKAANADSVQWLNAAQTSLDAVQNTVSQTASHLISSVTEGSRSSLQTASASAERALSAVISALNSSFGGAALFGGAETGSAPLASSDALLAALSTAVMGATNANDAFAAIDAWFADPVGGYSAVVYRGSPNQPVRLLSSEDTVLSFDIRANDPALVDTIKALSTAALAADPTFAGDAPVQADMIRRAAEQLFASEARLAEVRGELGLLQAQTDGDGVLLSSMRNGYEMALADLYRADPYETASKLDAATLQLEMIYSITARISELTLARYL